MSYNKEWLCWSSNELNDKIVEKILTTCPVRNYAKGEFIYRQGEKKDVCFLVLKGRIEISSENEDGQRKVFGIREPRCFIGISTLDGSPSLVNAICLEAVEVAVVSAQDINKGDREVLLYLLLSVIQMNKQLTSQLNGQTFDDVENRVENLLVTLSATLGKHEADSVVVTVPLTHQLISEMVGSSRVRVSQIIGELNKSGELVMNRSNYKLLKKSAL
ncbi:Crp/Fnr family transcriptional regulator [Desulfitobacterium chlororespirans]|uniref:cAMP-binding domain of CRP or a regulatory subunit of cAMP-dependent protein kinases n=1 Tax=Desulfitobacterium chlororespirans DSM 11544 TaxID=1121395 RepID=A0A1M7UK25_9FIRM|nr:Crp/Fnr family transcriptional regulator [Desulfitobacterium chlororespirans]SHN83266.1 cAMP-binding domain of CRP or a regulatory subunit of cAMP-dependent protein kinases [Desulfitobacterium chlororespirans DSM 11544]